MPSLESLPQELRDHIFKFCQREAFVACHRVSRTLAKTVRPFLFAEIHVSLEPKSWGKLDAISANPSLCGHVQELVLHPQLLPTFPDKAAWLQCVDVRPFRGQFYYNMLDAEQRRIWMKERPKEDNWLREAYDTMARWPDDVHDVYLGYRSAVERQSQLVENESFVSSFRDLLRCFPRLHTLREVPWHEGWFDPPYVRKGGGVDEISWYIDMLKPKDEILFKSEDLEEEWHGVHVCRSSILKARTVASRLFFSTTSSGALSPSTKPLEVRKVQVTVTLDGWYTLEHGHSDMDDCIEYRTIMGDFLRDLERSSISDLKELRLTVINGPSESELKQLMPRLRKLLDTGQSLTDLTLTIQTGVNDDHDMLADICKAQMSCLKNLELIGPTTTDQSLWTLLRNHASTLKSLSFREVYLAFGCSTWNRFLVAIPKHLSLEHFDADCLIDSGDHYNRGAGWIGPHSSSVPGLREYICKGGPWLDLLSSMDESSWIADSPNEQADSGWEWTEQVMVDIKQP